MSDPISEYMRELAAGSWKRLTPEQRKARGRKAIASRIAKRNSKASRSVATATETHSATHTVTATADSPRRPDPVVLPDEVLDEQQPLPKPQTPQAPARWTGSAKPTPKAQSTKASCKKCAPTCVVGVCRCSCHPHSFTAGLQAVG